jgi:peptidoglycan/LPS O-acetylase OafA/YrhL
MNDPAVFDHTSSGKEHFEVLDGLRGSAAFLIVVFHVFNYTFFFRGPFALVHHAYLAVDFFFALSGFVVAYAYDDRWTRMSVVQFFRIRLIRLHPLVLVGATFQHSCSQQPRSASRTPASSFTTKGSADG